MADWQGWTVAQKEAVNAAARDAFLRASVIGQILPRYGPLKESAAYVRQEVIGNFALDGRVKVTDNETTKFITFAVPVELSSEQVNDDDLTSALLAFRRAGVILARTEDFLFFTDQSVVDDARTRTSAAQTVLNAIAANATTYQKDRAAEALRVATRDQEHFDHREHDLTRVVVDFKSLKKLRTLSHVNFGETEKIRLERKHTPRTIGQRLVPAVVKAVAKLENNFHAGPFACVLGNKLYEDAHHPEDDSLVMATDRIKPILNGPLLRSPDLDENTGIVVSLSASDIDVVVATPPTVEYLNKTDEAKYRFRVYSKSVLRIKDTEEKDPNDPTSKPPQPGVTELKLLF